MCTPSNTCFFGCTRVHIPNGILIGSVVSAGLMTVTDRTDRPRHSVCNNRPHLRSTAMWPKYTTIKNHLILKLFKKTYNLLSSRYSRLSYVVCSQLMDNWITSAECRHTTISINHRWLDLELAVPSLPSITGSKLFCLVTVINTRHLKSANETVFVKFKKKSKSRLLILSISQLGPAARILCRLCSHSPHKRWE